MHYAYLARYEKRATHSSSKEDSKVDLDFRVGRLVDSLDSILDTKKSPRRNSFTARDTAVLVMVLVAHAPNELESRSAHRRYLPRKMLAFK